MTERDPDPDDDIWIVRAAVLVFAILAVLAIIVGIVAAGGFA